MILSRKKHKLKYMLNGKELEYTHFSSSQLKEEDLIKIITNIWKVSADKLKILEFSID
jgi:hypothetical protein